MWYLLAVMSALLFGLAGFFMKISQMRRGDVDVMLMGLYCTGAVGFGVNCLLEGTLNELGDMEVWLWAFIIGAGSAFGNAVFMKALEYGPASLTSPLNNLNIVLVVVGATLWLDEPLSLAGKWGIALLLGGVMLLAYRQGEKLTIKEKRWFAYLGAGIVLFAIRNGGLKVTDELELTNTPILFLSYLFCLTWFVWRSYQAAQKARVVNTAEAAGLLRIGWRWGALAGLGSYGGLQLYSWALHLGNANVVAPIFATNGLVVALCSIAFYHERLRPMQWTAMTLLFLGLMIIRL